MAYSSYAIVGVGVLGTKIAQRLIQNNNKAVVWGITATTHHHPAIRNACGQGGENLQLVTDFDSIERPCDHLIFCAPPSGFDDYPRAVADAMDKCWNGSGVAVFTSSGAVYGPGLDQGVVDEETPTVDATNASPRVARLVLAETAVRERGGCCLRLAGLYDTHRGAHSFWFQKGTVASSPDGIVNQLSYTDAADAVVAALHAGPDNTRGRVFLVSDGHPMTRQSIAESAAKNGYYSRLQLPVFEPPPSEGGEPFALGKVYNGKKTNELLNWQPKYKSFDAFMDSHRNEERQ